MGCLDIAFSFDTFALIFHVHCGCKLLNSIIAGNDDFNQ